jgi:hypothetical protein
MEGYAKSGQDIWCSEKNDVPLQSKTGNKN